MGRSWVRFPATTLSGNNLGQVVHTDVPLFTKLYDLVPCEAFHANVPVMWPRHGVQYKRFCSDLTISKNRDYLLYLTFYFTPLPRDLGILLETR